MKKIAVFFLPLLPFAGLFSQSNNAAKLLPILETYVDLLDDSTPFPLNDNMGVMDEISFEDGVIGLSLLLHEKMMDFSTLSENEQIYKSTFALMGRYILENGMREYLEEIGENPAILASLWDCVKGMRVAMLEDNTHRGHVLNLTTDDLKSAASISDSDIENDQFVSNLENNVKDEALSYEMESVTRENCPMYLGDSIWMTSVSYKDKVLTYKFRISEKPAHFDYDLIKQQMVRRLLNPSSEDSFSLIQMLQQMNASICFDFDIADEEYKWQISSDEIKSAFSEKKVTASSENARMQVEDQVSLMQPALPVQVDEVTRVDSVKIVGDNVVYYYLFDSENTEFDFTSPSVKYYIHFSNRNVIQVAGPLDQSFIKAVANAKMNLEYCYRNARTGAVLSDIFTYKELLEILEDN